ncbi:MAG: hypothetical protein IPI67_17350 [Myxococcales bacterium]|nr:hypothetical protein [Myxococcales bacterium]
MPTHTTYCRICEACCGLLADVEHGRLVRLRPDPDHVVSRGYACAKGTRFLGMHESHERLDVPKLRQGGDWVDTTWEHALGDAGKKLRRIRELHGPHSVAVYLGNPAAFGYALPLFTQAFVKALGTRNFFTAGSLDCNNKFVVSDRMLGSAMTHPVPDLARARFALYARLPELRATLTPRPADGRLRLITKRERLGHNSWMHANPRLSGHEQRAHLSPADATRLGIASGDWIRLQTPSGSIELRAEVNADVAPGALAVPHGFGHDAASGWSSATARGGQNVNELAAAGPGAVDPLSGMTELVGLAVEVTRIAAADVRAAE